MAKNLVVKDNALINASYNLELVEQRLILLSIIEARTTGNGITPNDALTISASSYMNNFNTNRNTAYQALKDACNSLFERQFSFIEKTQKGTKVVRTRWVSRVAYLENEGLVELTFAPDVAPLITFLEKNFTSYELEQISELNSKYSVRLYEIVVAWRSVGKTPMITIDKLRECLGVVDDEYIAIKNLKARVIDASVKQISEKTNINLSYKQHKRGRKIIGFTFIINLKSKKTIKQAPSLDIDLSPQNEQEQELVAQKNTYADQIGATTEHRQNLVNQALQRHREAEKERIARLEAERQAELARKKQEAERAEQARKREQAKQAMLEAENQAFIAYFESLTAEEQEQILDDVQKSVLGSMTKGFKQARLNGKAHTMTMYRKFFKDVMGL